MTEVCTHLDQVALSELPASVDGCDDSPNRHATAHHHATSHPIIRSIELGEDWSWCYVDEVAFLLDGIRGTTRIPPSPLSI